MSMILYACVVRLCDGLPLSASTDFHVSKQVLQCKKRLKALCPTLSKYPPRGTANVCGLIIHFCSAGDISTLVICSTVYPPAMAFSFLEELHWEFSAFYNSTTIALVTRPYVFLEFDSVIQRVKHSYNIATSPPIRLDPSPPPVLLKVDDMEEVNGLLNGYSTSHMQSAPNYRMTPVTALGILSLTLNIMCSALSLIRGVHLAENSFQEGYENAGRVVAFLTAFSANILQCYLYLFYSSARKIKACGLFLIICLCNIYLYGLRNLWQIFFHVLVAMLAAQQIFTRKTAEKQSDCGV
ncbi:vesicle-trafficking protein SEC22c [Bombina bombina]|uniref:vesicle-trafficking protein SEC22c n=1 Tax=Bombina bombina TaxID=8345 RepID=UPI00235A7979|nr:vesicle-trafficking protein SEC22c [Bombina bombina]XP_053569723.1 vesicle-trafficking protein SEC22c [Bombina bombina]